MLVETALMCLALNIYHEARSEPVHGQYAVAQVTLRRAEFTRKRVCAEVFRPFQFSWTVDKVRRLKRGWRIAKSLEPAEWVAWTKAVKIAQSALLAKPIRDYSRGATHYHSKRVKPRWAKHMKLVAVIGQHVFYRET